MLKGQPGIPIRERDTKTHQVLRVGQSFAELPRVYGANVSGDVLTHVAPQVSQVQGHEQLQGAIPSAVSMKADARMSPHQHPCNARKSNIPRRLFSVLPLLPLWTLRFLLYFGSVRLKSSG